MTDKPSSSSSSTKKATESLPTPEEVLTMWQDFFMIVRDADENMYKSMVLGNASAGIRARNTFRDLRKRATSIIRAMSKIHKESLRTKTKIVADPATHLVDGPWD